MFLKGEFRDLRVQLQVGDVVCCVRAALPPAVCLVQPSGAEYGGVRPVAVLHHPAAPKCFRNTGAGGCGGAAGVQVCTQIVLS